MKINFPILALLLAVLFLFVGCITFAPPATPICDTIPDGSYSILCTVAERINTTPETVGSLLKIGNVAALASDKYTAQQALIFIDEVEAFLKEKRASGFTYEEAVKAIKDRYLKLPPAVQALFIIYENAIQIQEPEIVLLKLSDFDWANVLGHLTEQRKIILPFLIQ